MQLAIDISVETPEALELGAQFLMQHAALKRAGSLPAYTGGEPFGSNADVPAGTIPTPPPVIPTPPPSNVSNLADYRDSAFRGHSDASPLAGRASEASVIPPAPPAAAIPPAPTVTATVPSAPASANVTPAAPAGTADEYDSAGMPWDARIHQKGKGLKKDKTWKLQKGIDEAIVSAVTKELFTSGRVRSPAASTPAPVGASAPVSVQAQIPPPPGFTQSPAEQAAALEAYGQGQAQGQGAAIPPPPPGVTQEQVAAYPQAFNGAIPPPPPPAVAQAEGQAQAGLVPPAPGVPMPPTAVLGVPNGNNAGVVQDVDPFRAFVAKVTAARTAGKITAEQVTALIQAAGAPSLQLLKNMPHLLPAAELELETHLAMA